MQLQLGVRALDHGAYVCNLSAPQALRLLPRGGMA